MVAENSSVWRGVPSRRSIFRKAWMKPMSSIWSASSSTRYCAVFSITARRSVRSSRRPGVATRMSVPRARCLIWELIDCPPTTEETQIFVPFTYSRRLSAIWFTSSRVGARMRARTDFGWGRSSSPISRSTSGRPKAAVLPVPVCASPITSRPSRTTGMALSWIGVGLVMPSLISGRVTSAERPNAMKASAPRGAGVVWSVKILALKEEKGPTLSR